MDSHPWETIVKAAWRKYPNPMNTGVIGVDVIKRKSCNGIMYTHRLVSSEWGFPKWSQRVSIWLSYAILVLAIVQIAITCFRRLNN